MGQTMRVVAIAKALTRRGHEVKFLAGGKLAPVIRELGLEVVEALNLPQHDYPSRDQLDDPGQQEKLYAQMQDRMRRIMEIETEAAEREKPELLLCGTLTGPKAARQLGIPSVLTFLQPHGPKTLAMFTRRLKDSRVKEGLSGSLEAADMIILEGMPEISGGVGLESLGADPAELRKKIHFTGPLLTEYPDELPDRETLKEKHCGSRSRTLVYVTIGGGSQLIGEAFLQVVLDALAMLPQLTGVIATGMALPPETIKALSPPANVFVRGFVPGTELIKASDVTLFHGGSSTLMTCLACGAPAIVVPSIDEQEDNGAVLAQNGAGIVLDKATLNAGMLAEAIQRILDRPDYRRQAAHLKALGDRYGGAVEAARLAEQVAAREAVLR